MENCGSFKGFGFIYIYIYIYIDLIIHKFPIPKVPLHPFIIEPHLPYD